MGISKLYTRSGHILVLILLFISHLNGQSVREKLKWQIGLMGYNQMAYGGVSTLSRGVYYDGFTMVPSIGISYSFNSNYNISFRTEYSWLLSLTVDPSSRIEWLENTTTIFQLEGSRKFKKFKVSLLITGVDHSVDDVAFINNGQGLERWGPGISLGYQLNDYYLSLSKDIVYDFNTHNLSFWDWDEYLSLRAVKNIDFNHNNTPTKYTNNDLKHLQFSVLFGSEIIIDHYSDERFLTPVFFAEAQLSYSRVSAFYKRAFALNFLTSFSNYSYYFISNNYGLLYKLNSRYTIGASILSDSDILQRRAYFLEQQKRYYRTYFIHGYSLHFNMAVEPKIILTGQLDIISDGLTNRDNTMSDAQLRLGLKYRL